MRKQQKDTSKLLIFSKTQRISSVNDLELYKELKKLLIPISEIKEQLRNMEKVQDGLIESTKNLSEKIVKSNQNLSEKIVNLDKKFDSLSSAVDYQSIRINEVHSSGTGLTRLASISSNPNVLVIGACFLLLILLAGSDGLIESLFSFLQTIFK